MANIQWITVNQRLQQGVELINQLNFKKYELLLTHIISSPTDNFFTETELQKLQETLKLSESHLQLLLQSIAYVYKQSSRIVIKPTDLQKQLENLGLTEEKAEFFVKKWSEVTQQELGELKNRHKLNEVKWELNLQMATDMGNKQAVPVARIQMDLSKVNDDDSSSKTILEMGEDELQQLYSQLEMVQLKLDNLTKK